MLQNQDSKREKERKRERNFRTEFNWLKILFSYEMSIQSNATYRHSIVLHSRVEKFNKST